MATISDPIAERPIPFPYTAGVSLERARRFYCVAAIWLLPVLTFTYPGRPIPAGPSTDPLTLMKMGALFSSLGLGTWLTLHDLTSRRFARVLAPLFPLFVFLIWAILTVGWSPIKGVSLGQAGGLTGLMLLMLHVARLSDDPLHVSWLSRHLFLSLLAYATLILAVYVWDPIFSGLDRSIMQEGGDGFVHPTAAGALAALGLVLTALFTVGMRFPWMARWFVLSVLVHGALLYLSHSRTAVVMAGVVISLCLFYFSGTRFRAGMLVGVAVVITALMVADPGLRTVGGRDSALVNYVLRGQNMQQIQGASGRVEMWTAMWDEYQHAVIKGHGYFVTSRDGNLYVWNEFANHTAHNVFLQVLVSTGLIGLSLWLFGFLRAFHCVAQLRKGSDFDRAFLAALVLVALWFAGWTTGCISFMGPLRSESIVLFVMLGMGVGLSVRNDTRPQVT